MTTLRMKSPCCSRSVRGVRLTDVATEVGNRTCPKCRRRWRLVVRPAQPIRQGWASVLEWTEMKKEEA